jgi:hypothetical protein
VPRPCALRRSGVQVPCKRVPVPSPPAITLMKGNYRACIRGSSWRGGR